MGGKLSGYNGRYDWDDPDKNPYPESMRYVGMRAFCTMFTVFLPHMAYLTMKIMGLGFRISALASWMTLFGTLI